MQEPTKEQRETLATVAKIVYSHTAMIGIRVKDNSVVIRGDHLDLVARFPDYQALAVHLEKRLQEWHAATCGVLDSIIAGETVK